MTCQSGKCTRQAVYRCEVKFIETQHIAYVRQYCSIHVRQLGQGIQELIDKYDYGAPLHDSLEVEHVND